MRQGVLYGKKIKYNSEKMEVKIMKRYFSLLLCAALCLGCLAFAACGAPAQPEPETQSPTESETQLLLETQLPAPTANNQEPTKIGTEQISREPEEDMNNDDIELGIYRPTYYSMFFTFADLVGSEAYIKWALDMVDNNYEEYLNECIAVSFIKKFNISKEDFARANEAKRQSLAERGDLPEDSSLYELYPVDLIYTFDNKRINEFFLWENSIYANEV
jgi:hypothetical protein